MDPTKNWTEQVELASELVDYGGSTDAIRLAKLVLELDRWVSSGGAPPEQWDKHAGRREPPDE